MSEGKRIIINTDKDFKMTTEMTEGEYEIMVDKKRVLEILCTRKQKRCSQKQ